MTVEPITGRYLTVEIEGQVQRIYFEEAGQGRPVLCLHTAGADTRQWRHLMNDPEITANHRLIAFDMPWHGKSLPPEGYETEEYLLTTESYIATVLAMVEGIGSSSVGRLFDGGADRITTCRASSQFVLGFHRDRSI